MIFIVNKKMDVLSQIEGRLGEVGLMLYSAASSYTPRHQYRARPMTRHPPNHMFYPAFVMPRP